MRTQSKSVWQQLGVASRLFRAVGYILFFSLFINLLILTSPIYMMQVFDRVLVTGQVSTLVYLSLIAFFCLLIFGALDAVRGQLLSRIGAYIDINVREPLLSSTISQSRRDGINRARLLDDLGNVRNYLGSAGLIPFIDAPWVPFFLIVITFMHPYLGLLATAAAVVLLTLAILNDRASRTHLRDASALQIKAGEFANAAITNADVIHAMGMQAAIADRFRGDVANMSDANLNAADRGAVFSAISKTIRVVVQVAILGVGAWLVSKAELTAGGMIAASIILGRALAPVEQAIGSWRGFVGARDAYVRIKQFLSDQAQNEERISLPDIKGKLSVQNVGYRLPGSNRVVLQRVSFELEPGTVVAVIGPSASGKSTLCRLIVGSWTPAIGKVRLDGAEITSIGANDISSAVGYLPQGVELFDGTVKENIARLGTPDDAKVIEAAKLAGCHEMILHLPDGYETRLGPHGTYLSGGQRQRVGLARALYGAPRLIVLDEPNANLDQEGEQALVEAMKACKQRGATVVVVSHRTSILRPVDKIAVLKDGVLDKFGDRDEVLRDLSGRPAPKPGYTGAASAGIGIPVTVNQEQVS